MFSRLSTFWYRKGAMLSVFNRFLETFSPFKRFFQNLFIVFSGGAFSELIPICIAPVLTRIYFPEDFGEYGIIVSVSLLLSQFSTLRYENAIVISKNSHEVFTSWKFCEYLTIFIHLLYFVGSTLVATCIVGCLFDKDFFVWCILMPLVSFSGAFLRIQILLANREERFKSVFNSRIITTSLIATFGILSGLSSFISNGLILALILGNLVGSFFLRYYKTTTSFITKDDLLYISKRYKNFLHYSLPGDLISNGASYYPLIVFPFMMGNEIGGYLALAYRVVAIPSRFLANAVKEIFFQYARKEMDSNKQCKHLFLMTASFLLVSGLIGYGILFLLSDYVFEIFFGEIWKPTGMYIRILIPLFLISFVVFPLSPMIYVSEKQNLDLFWQTGYLITIIATSFGGWFFGGNIEVILYSFVIGASGAYVVYFWILFCLAKGDARQ